MARLGFDHKALTKHLAAVAQEISTTQFGQDGEPITNEEALARLMFKKALGFVEETRNDEGTLKRIIHKPESWAMQYIFERIEGKATPAMPDAEAGVRAADKVRALAKERLNAMASTAAGVTKPPIYKPKKDE